MFGTDLIINSDLVSIMVNVMFRVQMASKEMLFLDATPSTCLLLTGFLKSVPFYF